MSNKLKFNGWILSPSKNALGICLSRIYNFWATYLYGSAKTHKSILYNVVYSDNHIYRPMYQLRCHEPQKSEKCIKYPILKIDIFLESRQICQNAIFLCLLFSQVNMDSFWSKNRCKGHLGKINYKTWWKPKWL